ncbi:MAG: hypothetical protein EHM58_06310 [Ignavibacteriae bacterium]|nr:MAG: hypothetical protein EHM58_06310 [Ignavibacteriota bacterium]
MKLHLLYITLIIIIIFSGCGEELDLSQFPTNQNPGVIGDTVYIPQSPAFMGFDQPADIFIGNEPLIYIADRMNNRIVQLDIAGGVIGYSIPILRPKKITQDKNYDLLVIATIIDTIPPNILDSVDVVYRFKLRNNNGLITGLQPTIAFKSNQATPVPGDHGRFTGITSFPDNYYVVSRSGPNNSSQIDPDNAFFKIDKYDNTIPVPQRLSGFEIQGQGLMSLQEVSSIVTIPYSYTDFIYTQSYSDEVFKVQWVVYDETEQIYLPKFTPSGNIDLLKNGLFSRPEAVTVDTRGNIYVIDSGKDSLYKFSGAGKLKSESFGGEGTTDTKFMNPSGVAFFYKTLYICDTGNNRILRFVLSTDIN